MKTHVLDLKDALAYAPGAVVSKALIDKPAGSVTLFAFDAGQNLSEHTAPFDAMVQVLDGCASVVIGDEEVTVAAGSMVVMPAGVPHAVMAKARFKMLLTMIRL